LGNNGTRISAIETSAALFRTTWVSRFQCMGTTRGLLVFGSTTGATRILAGAVKKGLRLAGVDVVSKNVLRTKVEELPTFPVLVMGCSTWENGCLQKDFQRFKDALGDLRLDGVLAAVFGPGSHSYPNFCRAVDVLEKELVARGATLALPSLRIDGSVYGKRSLAQDWAQGIKDCLT
jgi:flavodoxin I